MSTTKFQTGESGNPRGRPKGSKNKSRKLMEALEEDLPQLIEATKKKALQGDTAALRLLLERLVPAKKSESSTIVIGNLEKAKTLTDKANVIMDSIGAGHIPPDIGSNLITALGNTAKITEIDELMRRVEALEESG